MLLGAVVDVALEPATLGVLGVDQASRDSRSSSARADSSTTRLASSARSRTRCSTSPACAARPAKRRSSTGVSGWSSCSWSRSTPSVRRRDDVQRSRRRRRQHSAVRPRFRHVRRPARGELGHVVDHQPDLRPARTGALGEHLRHPRRHVGPVVPPAPVTASENLLSTSYGEPRPHGRPSGWPAVSSRDRTGSNATATIAVASTDRPSCGRVGMRRSAGRRRPRPRRYDGGGPQATVADRPTQASHAAGRAG